MIRNAYARFLKIRGNPKEIAYGFALGVLIGFTPFMGLHMAIAIFLAALFKWNKLAAGISVWVSNPLSAPILYGITYITGAKILGRSTVYSLPVEFDIDTLIALMKLGPEILWTLLVGGVVVGLPLSVVAYFLVYGAIVEYRKSIRAKIVHSTQTLKGRLHIPRKPPRKTGKRKKCRRLR
ncbi:MAG: DUF2062 domain-containing protein [Desulfobacterales bacterium]